MQDVRNNWFFQQHYTKEELNTLWKWIEEGGDRVEVKEDKGVWSGYHVLDTEMRIDIAGQKTQQDCVNWIRKLGLTVIN